MNAFIVDIASFLPNTPISNNQMEELLGMVGRLPSRTRKIILRSNGIKTRHYAIDPLSGAMTHNNARLTAEAVKRLDGYTRMELLCCGTSTPDQLMPGHASMVHGELARGPLETMTTSGICLSGLNALKYTALAVASGEFAHGVATGSEAASGYFRPSILKGCGAEKADALVETPHLSFEADFLRWMLSDGAGACLVSGKKKTGGVSLRIDWIDILSHAQRFEPCMYAGAIKDPDGTLRGWREFPSLREAETKEAFAIKQDVRLLNKHIIAMITRDTLAPVAAKHGLRPEKVTWYLPHYSSDYFRLKLAAGMDEIGFTIPLKRWFTNLATKGNTGSASIYIMLEELFHSGKLRMGDSILCMIPESGRFSCGFMHLSVV